MSSPPSYDLRPEDWTLYDKVLYGGFGYSEFCLPDNLLVIALTIIYPPLGMISYLVKNTISRSFPYLTARTFKNLFMNLNLIVQSIIWTMFLYIPGIIYTFDKTINNPISTNNSNSTNNSSSSNS